MATIPPTTIIPPLPITPPVPATTLPAAAPITAPSTTVPIAPVPAPTYVAGQLVWSKLTGYPMWPSRACISVQQPTHKTYNTTLTTLYTMSN